MFDCCSYLYLDSSQTFIASFFIVKHNIEEEEKKNKINISMYI